MNLPVFLGGIFASFVIIAFIIVACAEGVRMAARVVGAVFGIMAGVVLFVLFWAWVAGAFA